MTRTVKNKLAQLTTLMSDCEFHDGTALGRQLQITRSAVWKMIKKLERYDIEITSVKGRGYALCEPLIMFEESMIQKYMGKQSYHLILFENVESTNDYLKSLRNSRGVWFCLAEQQTEGRGRLSRGWYSPFGKNIYLSCLYPFHKDISELAGLSLVVSLAVVNTLKQFGIEKDLHVKWPNDVVCDHRKISGTLIEVQAESHGTCHAIIGVGLNVNMLIDERRKISQSWTSMRRATGKYFDRNHVAAELMKNLLEYLKRFNEDGFDVFTDEWMASEMMSGKIISVKTINESVNGEVQGINAQGHLILKLSDGKVRAFSSGDTSIVKK